MTCGEAGNVEVFSVPALFALSGCVVGAENARHDLEASKAAYKGCLTTRGSEVCVGLRQAYEADLSTYRATPKVCIGCGAGGGGDVGIPPHPPQCMIMGNMINCI
jgi:hypothetical protein